LHRSLRAVTEHRGHIDLQVIFTDVEVRQSGEHECIVVIFVAEFILKANKLEALTTNVTSVNGTLTDHVIDFLVSVGVILDTWAHADNNAP